MGEQVERHITGLHARQAALHLSAHETQLHCSHPWLCPTAPFPIHAAPPHPNPPHLHGQRLPSADQQVLWRWPWWVVPDGLVLLGLHEHQACLHLQIAAAHFRHEFAKNTTSQCPGEWSLQCFDTTNHPRVTSPQATVGTQAMPGRQDRCDSGDVCPTLAYVLPPASLPTARMLPQTCTFWKETQAPHQMGFGPPQFHPASPLHSPCAVPSTPCAAC